MAEPQKLDDKIAIQLKSEQIDLDAKLKEYEAAETKEDKALHTTYEAIQRGEKIVDVMEIITRVKNPGYSTAAQSLPTMAFAPASATEVYLDGRYRHRRRGRSIRQAQFRAGKWTFQLDPYVIDWNPYVGADTIWKRLEWMSDTPHIPRDIRNKFDIKDPNRLVAWEVPAWVKTKEESRVQKPIQIDPVLLHHLTGTLYVVEAVWDFSDLEAQLITGIKRGSRI